MNYNSKLDFAEAVTRHIQCGSWPGAWVRHVSRCVCRDRFVVTEGCLELDCTVVGVAVGEGTITREALENYKYFGRM